MSGSRPSAWARRAAADAAAALAYEEAARLYASALDQRRRRSAGGERAELLVALGGVELAAGRFPAAFAACRQAVALAESAGRRDLVAAAALTLDAVGEHSWDRSLQSWCLRALDALGDEPATTRGAPGCWAGWPRPATTAATRPARAEPAAQALGAAGDGGGPDALVAALRARQLTCSGPEHSDERAELAGRMTALGERLRRPPWRCGAGCGRSTSRWEHGDLAGIEAELTLLRWCVDQQRSPLADWHLLVGRAALAQARGDLDRGARPG